MSSSYRLLKVDTLSNLPIGEDTLEKISKVIKDKSKITIFSDFRHGIFNTGSINKLVGSIPNGTLKVADSQVASRWGNITQFKNFDLITPNEKEARFSLADQDSTVGKLAGRLLEKTKYKNLILKLGEKGYFCNTKTRKKYQPFSVGAFSNNVVDAVGSGDALLAYSSLALKATNSLIISGILGSFAAACACETEGNKPISKEMIIEKILLVKKKINLLISK